MLGEPANSATLHMIRLASAPTLHQQDRIDATVVLWVIGDLHNNKKLRHGHVELANNEQA